MRYALLLAGMATLATASPAPQAIDFDAVDAAPSPDITGPDVSAAAQTVTFSAADLGAAAVTAVASASATASVLASRNLDRRSTPNYWCLYFNWNCPPKSSGSTSTSTSSSPAATKTSSSYIQTTSIVPTSAPSTTSTPTSTFPSWVNTNSFTSVSGCPTPFEVGTYCGFINPEDPCVVQPDGYGPKVIPDTTDAFIAYAPFHSMAQSAKTPSGFKQTFQDLTAATAGNTYLGLETLHSYDVAGCAAYCNNHTDIQCTGFNIFVERDPSINPSAEYGCANPASFTNYKCTLWGSSVDSTTATNNGQYRDGFHVVIAGSNGYNRTTVATPPTPPGWGNPQHCNGHAHSHPQTCIGQHFFPGPYDPKVCASYATTQNGINLKAAGGSWGLGYNSKKCTFFNSYMLKRDGKPLGTYCSLFAQQYNPSAATYNPGTAAGHSWDIETSWSYCLAA